MSERKIERRMLGPNGELRAEDIEAALDALRAFRAKRKTEPRAKRKAAQRARQLKLAQ